MSSEETELTLLCQFHDKSGDQLPKKVQKVVTVLLRDFAVHGVYKDDCKKQQICELKNAAI